MSVNAPCVPVAPIGAVSAAAVPWRDRGQLRVTAIVKATFALTAGAPMGLLEPEAIYTEEVHHQNNPARSIRAASDLCPCLLQADVILTGHAYAPPGEAATRVVTRLSVLGREGVRLDKTLHIVGDLREGGVVPFGRLPMTYERAYGGIGYRDNPLGTGAGKDGGSPNIVDPRGPGRVAGYGPISRFWHARRSLISPDARAALGKPIAEIAGDFDLRYFQAAPSDQRISYLQGDEQIALECLHPEAASFRAELPSARAAARFYRHGQAGEEGTLLWLNADALHIDTDARTCSLTFRGSVPLEDDRALVGLWVAGALSLAGSEIAWPKEPTAAAPTQASPRGRVPLPSGTIEVHDAEETTLVKPPKDNAHTGPAPTERRPLATSPGDSTLQLSPREQAAAGRRRALPFEKKNEAPGGREREPPK